ncbi:MAG: BspA family leucine-rich repeat surface protein, partial [Erysipelotrichaceae bacterium]|nr:BspA family leucine-rich repeat surface protein [Erysipelotrichaceae bacterium]
MKNRWLSIVLVTLMFISNIPVKINVYAEEEPVVETAGVSEDAPAQDEVPPEMEDPVAEDPIGSDSDISEEAIYLVEEELEAVQVFGDAASSPELAAEALKESTSLSEKEIEEKIDSLFHMPKTEGEEDPLPSSMDGTQIEDNFAARWITEDTTNNDDPDLLYLRPGNNDPQKMRLQINYSLSGEHNYEPGDITITIPAYLFLDRNGKPIGNVTVPYPEDPSTKADFNWKRVGDQIILTNTKKMSAATTGYIQVEYSGITPSQVQDMKVSNDFQAKIEVVTWKGNLIGATSNTLNAQIDTEARITSANKGISSITRIPASQIPEDQRIEGEEEYILVNWYVYGNVYSNTLYELSFTDTIPTDEEGNPEYNGFIVDSTAKDYFDEDGLYHSGTVYTGYSSGRTSYYSVKTAYPASQFVKDTLYEFHNNAEMQAQEIDPEAEVNNPNVQDPDPKLVTTAECSAKAPWSFRDPVWIDPRGHYWMNKIGNDDKPKNNQTHSSSSVYSDTHKNNGSYYGIYPSALNEIREGKDIQLSYTINTLGYLMPWTYDPELPLTELSARMISNYFKKYLTLTTTDTGLKINGSALKVKEDYTYVSVEILDPYIYDGVPQNVNDDGTFTAMDAGDGTFLYTRNGDISKAPDIVLEIYRNGSWEKYATVSYSRGLPLVTMADGTTSSNTVIPVPSDTENIRTITTTNIAGIDYDIRPVVNLKNTDKLKEIVENLFGKSNTPSLPVYNGATMDVKCEGEDVVALSGSGFDSLRGYTTDTYVIPNKTAKQVKTDYENRLVTIHYTAKVEERSYIPERDIYIEAVNSGRLQHETSGIWYDLLPVGVTPVISTIKLRSNDSRGHVYTVENYKGSGRTLLVVEADLTVAPTTYRDGDNIYFEDIPSIEFDAVYSFESITDYGDLVHNVIAFESGNDSLGSIKNYTGEPDDPNSNNNSYTSRAFDNDDEKGWMKDLDKESDDPNFVYAGAYVKIDILSSARTSLSKDVDVNNEGIYTSGVYWGEEDENKRDVYEGGQYNYRLRMMSDTHTVSKDLILYDFLEEFYAKSDEHDEIDIDAPRWQGYLRGVDVSQLIEMGCAPVVYYSTVADMHITTSDTSSVVVTEVADLSNTEVWTKASDYSGSLDDVRAIAIDARKKADGSDFELEAEQSISVIVRMQAPSGEAARQAIDANAHAYNNAYLLSTSIDDTSLEVLDSGIIRKDYTKVGMIEFKFEVEKEWNDDNNRDGIRTEKIVVHLYADGVDTGLVVELSDENDWKDAFEHIPYTDPEGNKIQYTIVEDVPEGYRVSYNSNGTYSIIMTNRHDPEKIAISGSKTWEGDEEENRPKTVTVRLLANGVEIKRQTIKADANGDWNYSFAGLFKYENGEEIVYTVEEVYETGAGASYEPVVDGYDIKNVYHPYGELYLDKNVENVTDVSKDNAFEFTFEFTRNENGEEIPVFDEFPYEILDAEGNVVSSGSIGSNGTLNIDASQRIHVYEIDEYLSYKITETATDGFALKNSKNTSYVIRPNQPAYAEFTNVYSAKTQYNPEVKKVLLNKELQRYQFRFELYEVDEEGNETLIKTASNDRAQDVEYEDDSELTVVSSSATATFGAIKYTEQDAGKTYHYRVKETNSGKPGYEYDEIVYDAYVTITDNGDGTLNVETKYVYNDEEYDEAVFTNKYHAEGEVSLKAWKEVKGGTLEADMFTFALYDEEGNAIKDKDGNPITAKNSEDGTITIEGIEYDETDIGKTYTYVLKEVDEGNEDVTYDDSEKRYIVTVSDNGDGTLSTDMTIQNYELDEESGEYVQVGEDNDVPLFTNVMAPGYLAVSKEVVDSPDADPEQEFHFKVKLIGEGLEDKEIHYEIVGKDDPVPGDDDYADTSDSSQSATAQTDETTEAEQEAAEDNTSENGDTAFDFFDRISGRLFNKVYAEDGDIASGTWGECTWVIDADGVLTIGPTDGVSCTLANVLYAYSSPWYNYRDQVTAVKFNGTVKLSSTYRFMFYGMKNLVSIDFNGLDTSSLQNMGGWFYLCNSLKEVDLSPLDLSNITTIYFQGVVNGGSGAVSYAGLFSECKSLEEINLGNLNTSKITNMCRMFYDCNSLKSLDVSGFDTSNVTNMSYMFSGCNALEALDVSGFDTSKVTNMERMFTGCSKLTALDVERFNTAKVTNMTSMFSNCSGLTSLDLSRWDTSKVNSMNWLFANCKLLSSIDLTGWQTGNVNNMNRMFYNCQSLTSLDLSSFDTSKVTDMSYMFTQCTALESLDVSNFNTEKVSTMNNMFSYCESLEKLDLSSFKTPNLTNMYYIFEHCIKLKELDISGFDTTNVTGDGRRNWFDYDRKIQRINLGENFVFYNNTLYNPSGSDYSGKWIREDLTYGPYTSEQLRKNYTSEMAGWWVWEPAPIAYKIQFDGNGATGSMSTITGNARYDYALPANSFVYYGHKFLNWLDEENSYTYENEGSIPAGRYDANSTVTLVAQWEKIDYSAMMTDGEFEFTLHDGEKAIFDDIPAGTSYQVWEETPDGWILVEQHNVSGTIEPLTTAQADFYNRYEPGTTSVQFFGTKRLDGFVAEENAFSFELVDDATGEVIETVKTQDGGFIQFSVITYKEAGEYSYTIREVIPADDDKIQYDTHEEKVTITVEQNEEGALTSSVVYDEDGISFENVSNPGTLKITKSVDIATENNSDDEFYFKVTFTNEKGLPLESEDIYWYVEGQGEEP